MITLRPAGERGRTRLAWLDSLHTFSFNQYYDPLHMGFRSLRVINEDRVAPGKGFGTHSHRDMEIVTYVLAGELEHQDNQGNRGRVLAGEVQVMSAGTGIVHAERNPSPNTPLHLLQIWIVPRTRGLRPRWAQQRFPAEARRGTLLPVVTPSDRPAAAASTLGIDQDASVLVAALAPGEAVTHAMSAGRRAYLFAIAGALALNGRRIEAGDQARITDEPVLAIEASAAADLILIDLP